MNSTTAFGPGSSERQSRVAGRIEHYAQTGETRYPIREVLLSGGDPMVLSNKNLYKYMAAAAEAGVHLVRLGTKEMAFRPQRFDAHFHGARQAHRAAVPDPCVQ